MGIIRGYSIGLNNIIFLKAIKFNSMRSSIESAANNKNIKQNPAGGYKWKYK